MTPTLFNPDRYRTRRTPVAKLAHRYRRIGRRRLPEARHALHQGATTMPTLSAPGIRTGWKLACDLCNQPAERATVGYDGTRNWLCQDHVDQLVAEGRIAP